MFKVTFPTPPLVLKKLLIYNACHCIQLDVCISPQLESEYSECSSAMSSASRDLGVLGQTSECCGEGVPQVEQFRRLK